MRRELDDLLERTWSAVAETPDCVSGASVTVPDVIPVDPGIVESRFSESFPVMRYLEQAIDLAKGHVFGDLAERFASIVPHLRWSQNPRYTAENAGQALLDGYAYAAFSGPEGPVYCAAPRGGFMLMAPGVTYPPHSHGPREIYLMLTPGGQWSLDNGAWFDVQAGDLILHEPWVVHSMRTLDQPMLTFAGWVEPGDRLSVGFEKECA